MDIRLAVFDLAGTTVNDPDGVNICLRSSLEAAGLAVSRDEVNAVMGIAKPEAIRRLIEGSSAHQHLLSRIDAIHDDFVTRMVRFYQFDPSVYEIAGTSGEFARLNRAGVKVAVNTGFGRAITDVLLARLGWEQRGLIQASITCDEVARGRPHPDMIQALMKRFAVSDPSQVAKIGDTPADIQEGRNAGCGMVIAVTKGSHTQEELERFSPTHLIGTIADLSQMGDWWLS
jgi:phosphonatase-like hydrolase